MSIIRGTGITSGNGITNTPQQYFKVADVAKSGAKYTSIQAAIDALNSGLSDTQKALIRVFPGLYLENVVLPEFFHVIGFDSESVWIGGDTTVDDDIVTVGGASSIQHVTIVADQANKRAALKVIPKVTALLDVRYFNDIVILDGVTKDLDIGIEYLATSALGQPIWFDECKILITAGQCINSAGTSTGNFSVRDTELQGSGADGALLIDGAAIKFSGSNIISGGVKNNVASGFRPIGSEYPIPTGTGTIESKMPHTQMEMVGFTDGSILYKKGSIIAEDNANLFWDDAAKALGVGTAAPDGKAILDLVSTTKGFLQPRMTTAQKNAITSPPPGLQVFDTDLVKIQVFNGTTWENVGPDTSHIQFNFILNGNLSTGIKIDGGRVVPFTCTIVKVVGHRVTAGGTGGSTIIDVNKNGTTIYTTQANRPTFTQAAGDDLSILATDPDVLALAVGDALTMDIDQTETGASPKELSITVYATVD